MLHLIDRRGRKEKCILCNKISEEVSSVLKICLSCIKNRPDEVIKIAMDAHRKIREEFRLPPLPPRDEEGILCKICANECRIGKGSKGYCGVRRNLEGKIVGEGLAHTYYDPLPTNCCAGWFCEGNKEKGYNLAVFSFGCSFNCIFCQNWEHKCIDASEIVNEEILLEKARYANCICYFGGSPEPQLPFFLKVNKRIAEETKARICWEWNGTGNKNLVRKAAEYSYVTGGTVKFDLKAFDENLNIALTGISNKRVIENFEMIANEFDKENFLNATTLLIPGYIDSEEVEKIAKFISSLDENIPYSLLAFHPDFKMLDMPFTTKKLAMECYASAKKHLKRVNIGNEHLLW
ncbi:MAG: radical SAM protein [Thermoplasmatales archaeon]|nr:radical SAM protein [Thermoplasmatales archaeon]